MSTLGMTRSRSTCSKPGNIEEQLSNANDVAVESTPDGSPVSRMTIEDAATAAILPIRCKQINAEFHRSKFGSGSKGKCIKVGSTWLTPTEFEVHCGRANSKDWKRSIRYGGRTLQTLIEKGFLVPHALSCICSVCVDDASASAPVRHFTPYRRKRRYEAMPQRSLDEKKLKFNSNIMKTEDESSDVSSNPGLPMTVESSIGPLANSLLKITQTTLPPTTEEAWKVIEDAVDGVMNAAVTLKTFLKEMKERTNQETENLRAQIENCVDEMSPIQYPIAAGEPNVVRVFDSDRVQTYTIELMNHETFKPSFAAESLCISKCQNCGREGTLECSGCQGVRYCSVFCQRKDWPTHQTFCRDSRQNECKNESDA